jgi:hypothetical protein
MEFNPMSYGDSPEVIASRLSSEITRAETRLSSRIHELEMSLIRRSRDDFFWIFALGLPFFMFMFFICLASHHSNDSSNAEHAPQASHAEASPPEEKR